MTGKTPPPPHDVPDGATSRQLTSFRDDVMARWEMRVGEALQERHRDVGPVVLDGLPAFLDELANVLGSPAPHEALLQRAPALALHQGQQRGALAAYSLDRGITGYRLLRQVILEVLEPQGISPAEREVVLDAIHAGLINAAREHTRSRDAERDEFAVAGARAAHERQTRANHDLEARVQERTASLVRNEQLFRGLVEAVDDYAISTLDVSGHVTTWNTGAERMQQYTASEIVGQHFSILYPDEGKRREEPMSHLRAAAREGRFRGEGVRMRKDGARFLADVLIQPMYEEGKLFGFSEVVQDLTERNQLVQERDRSRTDVVRRDGVIAAIIHDLRSPMQGAQMAAELIDDAPDSDKVREWAAKIKHLLKRLDLMLTDVLDASRAQSGQLLHLHVERCDLREVIEQSRDDFGLPLASRINIDVEGDTTMGWWSKSEMRRLVDNLLSNAGKYGDGDRPITARLRAVGQRMLLAVHNDGPIIAIDEMKRLFTPFHRTAGATQSGKPGWGLGLALVRAVAEAHGGTVKVESYPVEGTTFTVDLPLDARTSVASTPRPLPQDHA